MFLSLAQVNTTHAALVVIDNFSGFHLGTRTVTLSNNDGLSPMPLLEETGGQAIMRLHSQGNSGNLIRFTYSNFGVYDFTDGGTNEGGVETALSAVFHSVRSAMSAFDNLLNTLA
jgi:hypothetical protein